MSIQSDDSVVINTAPRKTASGRTSNPPTRYVDEKTPPPHPDDASIGPIDSVRSVDSSGPTQSDKDFVVGDKIQSGHSDFLPTQSELDAASFSTGSSTSSDSGGSLISEITAYVQGE